MLPVEILYSHGAVVLRARNSELLILPQHVKALYELKKPQDFSSYFMKEALVNRPARKLFEAWLRKDKGVWPKLFKTIQDSYNEDDFKEDRVDDEVKVQAEAGIEASLTPGNPDKELDQQAKTEQEVQPEGTKSKKKQSKKSSPKKSSSKMTPESQPEEEDLDSPNSEKKVSVANKKAATKVAATSKKVASKKVASKKVASKKVASKKVASKKVASKKVASKKVASKKTSAKD